MSRWAFPPLDTINPFLLGMSQYDLRDSEIQERVRNLVVTNSNFYFKTILGLDFHKEFHVDWFQYELQNKRTLLLAPRDSLKCVHPLTIIPSKDGSSYIQEFQKYIPQSISSVFKSLESKINAVGTSKEKTVRKIKIGPPYNFWIISSDEHKFFCFNIAKNKFEVVESRYLNSVNHLLMLARPSVYEPLLEVNDYTEFDKYLEYLVEYRHLHPSILKLNKESFDKFQAWIYSVWSKEYIEKNFPWAMNAINILNFYFGNYNDDSNAKRLLKSRLMYNQQSLDRDQIAFLVDEDSDFIPSPLQCNKNLVCFVPIDSNEVIQVSVTMYDCACDNSHYIANGFVTHNSTVTTVGACLYSALTDPEKRYAIISSTGKLATGYVRKIRRICQTNPVIRYCFQDVVNPNEIKVWSSEAIEFVRKSIYPEPTIWALGEGTDFTGFHFDEAHFDDLVTLKHRKSATLRKHTWDWFKMTAIPAINRMGGVAHVKGTRYHWDDMYGKLIEISESTGGFKILRTPAFDEKLFNQSPPVYKSFWPERFSVNEMLEFRTNYGEEAFQLQYMCAAGAVLTEKNYLNKIKERILPIEALKHIVDVVLGVDLASKGTLHGTPDAKKSSFSITAIGRHEILGKWVALESIKIKRPTLHEQREWVESMTLKWNPLLAAIEQNAYQNVFSEYLEEGSVPVSIKPIKSFESKDARFDYIMGLIAAGSLYFIEGLTQPLLNEIYSYPECTADAIDSCFFALRTGYREPRIRFMHEDANGDIKDVDEVEKAVKQHGKESLQ